MIKCGYAVRDDIPVTQSNTSPATSVTSIPRSVESDRSQENNFREFELKTGEFVDVFISYVIDPSHFYCQLTKYHDQLTVVMQNIMKEYSVLKDHEKVLPSPSVGDPCIAKFSADGAWYRAKVLSILDDTQVLVRFIDYGNEDAVNKKQVKLLKKTYRELPAVCLKCGLSDIAPTTGTWSEAVAYKFEEMVLGKNMVAGCISENHEGTKLVELVDSSTTGQPLVNDEMVKLGLAKSLTQSETSSKRRGLTMSKIPSSSSIKSDTSSTSSSGQGSVAAINTKYKKVMLDTGSAIDVNVVHIDTPENFFIQQTKNSEYLEDLMKSLSDEYSPLSEAKLAIQQPQVGQICAGRFTEDDEYYRAEILDVKRSEVEVRYVDYGNTEWVKMDRIKQLKTKFIVMAEQAIRCKMSIVSELSPEYQWTKEEISKLEDITIDKNLVAKVKSFDGTKYTLELVDPDGSVSIDKSFLGAVRAMTTLQEVHKPPSIQLKEQNFAVGKSGVAYISWFTDVGNFFLQWEDSTSDLKQLQEEMYGVYQGLKLNEEKLDNPEVGQVCVALFADDGNWYRAKIVAMKQDKARVLFLDYGNLCVVNLSKVKNLMPNYSSWQLLAFKSKLHGIDPTAISPAALVKLQSISSKPFQCTIKGSQDGVYEVSLTYDDGKFGKQADLGDMLMGKKSPLSNGPSGFGSQSDSWGGSGDRGGGFGSQQDSSDGGSTDNRRNHESRGQFGDSGNRNKNERGGFGSSQRDSRGSSDRGSGFGSGFGSSRPKEESGDSWGSEGGKRSGGGFGSGGGSSRDGRDSRGSSDRGSGFGSGFGSSGPKQDSSDSWGSGGGNRSGGGFGSGGGSSRDGRDSRGSSDRGSGFGSGFGSSGPKQESGDSWGSGGGNRSGGGFGSGGGRNRDSRGSSDRGSGFGSGFGSSGPKQESGDSWGSGGGNRSGGGSSFGASRGRESGFGSSQPQSSSDGFGEEESWGSSDTVTKTTSGFGNQATHSQASKVAVEDTHIATLVVPTSPTTVAVSQINSPYHFFVQMIDKIEALEVLVGELGEFYSNSANQKPLNNASVGSSCAAKFTEDESWYRAKIQSLKGTQADVLFVDYGNSETQAVSGLKSLDARFCSQPPYSVECTLDMLPGTVTPEAQAKFEEITEDQEMTCEFVGKETDKHKVKLTLSEGGSVNQEIIKLCPKESTSAAPALSFCKQKILTGSMLKAYISVSENPAEFYIQLAATADELQSLTDEVNVAYSSMGPEEQQISNPQIGSACCAKFEDDAWYRAKVLNIKGNQISVLFVDFGNSATVALSEVKSLTSTFISQPPFAFYCCLGGVIPGSTFKEQDIKNFLDMLPPDEEIVVDFKSEIPPYSVEVWKGDIHINPIFRQVEEVESKKNITVKASAPEFKIPSTKPEVTTTTPSVRDFSEKELAYVSHVESARQMYLQMSSWSEDLENFSEQLELFCSSQPQLANVVNSLEKGRYCAAKYSEDGVWYRAEVLEKSGNKVTVQFIDYGNGEEASSENLRMLSPDLLAVKKMSVECSLWSAPEETSEELLEQILEMTLEKELTAVFQGDRTIEPVTISLIDSAGNIINDILFNKSESRETLVEEFSKEVAKLPQTTEKLSSCKFLTQKKPELPQQGYIVHTESISEFYIQLSSEEEQLQELSDTITNDYSELDIADLRLDNPQVGQICCSQFSVDASWYRAVICNIEGDHITVQFVDFGNTDTVELDSVRQLRDKYIKFPPFGYKCSLSGLPDSAVENLTEIFSKLIEHETLNVTFLSEIEPFEVKLKLGGENILHKLLKLLGKDEPESLNERPTETAETVPEAIPKEVTKPSEISSETSKTETDNQFVDEENYPPEVTRSDVAVLQLPKQVKLLVCTLCRTHTYLIPSSVSKIVISTPP